MSRASRRPTSPSRYCNKVPSSGWASASLLIAHLLQPHHGAAEKLPHRARADTERRTNLRISQTFHAQEQAALLLLAQAFHRVVKAQHAFAIQQFALRRVRVADIPRPHLGIERFFGLLPCPDLESQIVRHPEDPGARILNLLPFAQRRVQAKKTLLHRLLRAGRIKPQREQIPVDVVARSL